MRRRLMLLAGLAARTAAPWTLATSAASAAATPVLRRARESVVKVEADGAAASGFLWPDAQHVVTALHVVDGRQRLVVHLVDAQGRITASLAATVARVLKEADLVLLKLPQPLPRLPLPVATKAPAVSQTLDALGFPLNIAGHSSTQVRVRFGGETLRSILPPKLLRLITDYPDTALTIVNLEGNLVPGLSGAPLLDAQGQVVGVADGGLEEGAVGICWGIPAAQLDRLAASTVTGMPGAPRLPELFAADLQARVEPGPQALPGGLVRVRSRSLAELQATADDALGLAQLTQLFAQFQPDSLRFDIYQDPATGAALALPEGVRLRVAGDLLAAAMDEPRLEMKLQIRTVDGPLAAQAQSVRFEQQLTGVGQPGVLAQLDPAWSYLMPLQRGPLLVTRKASAVHRLAGGQWQPDSYVFETVATNGRGFLGVAAVNKDVAPATLMLETACAQGVVDDRCPGLAARRRRWAQMVLAVQFASFPTRGW